MRLPFQPPLDWDAMLGYFRARAIIGVESVTGRTYRRTIANDGDPGVIELSPGEPDHLVLRVQLPQREGSSQVVWRARRIFNLDCAVESAVRDLGKDPIVGPLVRARPGIRPPGAWDPFEIGVRAVVGQQVSVRGAGTITARIVERHGVPVPGQQALGLTHLFPSPSTLADADLSGLGLMTARIAAIHAFAEAVVGRAVTLDRSTPLERLVDSVTAIPGLGPWTAHYLALRLGEPDAFPASDLGIRRALSSNGKTKPIPTRQAQTVAERWRPWRAHAAAHLWLDRRPNAVSDATSVRGCRS
jgi:AraC family transcriptional regulator, regulatory protein of adaptative response / DNA-3-methyladenine glycosylase II